MAFRSTASPLRFGKYRKLKALALLGVMAAIGLGGYETYEHDGIEFRSAVELYKNTADLRNRVLHIETSRDTERLILTLAVPPGIFSKSH